MWRGNPLSACPFASGIACAKESLDAAGIKVVALSVDEKTSSEFVEKLHLDFPIAHSADADESRTRSAPNLKDEPRYLQSTGFVLEAPSSLPSTSPAPSDACCPTTSSALSATCANTPDRPDPAEHLWRGPDGPAQPLDHAKRRSAIAGRAEKHRASWIALPLTAASAWGDCHRTTGGVLDFARAV